MLKLDKNKNYLLACSFGPDSMALFNMLLKEKFNFSAALVNYHIRPESTDEMNGFIKYCQDNNIIYYVKDLVDGIGNDNLEATCRKIRYEFFAQLVKEFKYDAVLVAHNQDDLIETYLMQKSRQNLVNFYGIKEISEINNVTIIRPLLDYPKETLKEYCLINNVLFAIDSSNFDEKYLRNKIRHQTVKKMSIEDRNKIINEIDNKNDELAKITNKLSNMDLSNINVLQTLNDDELVRAFNMLIKTKDNSLYVSKKQCLELKKEIYSGEGNIEIPISHGYYFSRNYEKIEFLKPEKINYSFIVDKPMILDTEYFYLDATGDTSNRNIHLDDYPLTIRNYRSGDKYKIKNYVVPVRRLFIDWKMPLSLRQKWPIILNKDGVIIYIPRYKKDFKIIQNLNFYVH